MTKWDKSLSGLVADWGGFEQVVADLHTENDVTVERNVELPAKEGRTYKIDVVVRWRQGFHEMMMIIECKWWNERVGRDRITHLKHVREQVGANKAVCFTSRGYQAGAETVARSHDIGLFVVREMTDPDWGRPGKDISFYLQFYQAAVSPLVFPNASYVVPSTIAPRGGEALRFKSDSDLAFRALDGGPTFTALDLYKDVRRDAYGRALAKARVLDEGSSGGNYVAVRYHDVEFQNGPREVTLNGRIAYIRNFSCDLIFQIRQDTVNIDRGTNIDFALVVEDYLTGDRYATSRRTGLPNSERIKLASTPATNPDEAPIQNGSIMAILIDKWLDYRGLRAAKLAQDPGTELLPAE